MYVTILSTEPASLSFINEMLMKRDLNSEFLCISVGYVIMLLESCASFFSVNIKEWHGCRVL